MIRIGKKLKLTAVAVIAAVLMQNIAYASILGTANGGWQTDMGGGAVYSNNVFVSESVGKQTENLVEYTPNSESVPIVVNGSSIYGLRTITSASDYMKKNNLRPLVGINGDFFSTKTGIPMGYTITDGKILSKESGVQDAVGFCEDGTGFIDKLGIDASLTFNDKKIQIQYINKWAQEGFNCVYMLDSNFSDTTKTDFNALYVICSPKEGDLSLNSEMKLVVDDVYIKDSAIKIPSGKYVFVMDPNGNAEYSEFLSNLAKGDVLLFKNSVYGAERHDWQNAKYAISSIGGRLINNGVIGTGFSAGAAPRTAVGIKENGNIIFYTIDGRQKDYSYGVQIKTLASRMAELGCIDALNLDGGGSTAIGGVFPGSESFLVSNRPSDGRERRCANYLFLQDLRQKTGIVWYVDWKKIDNYNFMAGMSCKLEAEKVFDTGNYKMDGLGGISFEVENSEGATATIDDTGLIKFSGTGQVKVSVTGEKYSKVFTFETYETPDELKIINEATGEEVTELTVEEGGMINYSLEAGAYVNNVRLESLPSLFKWESVGSMSEVDENGNVSIKDDGSKSGIVRVTVGNVSKEIPIKTVKKSTFADTNGHWANDVIEKMAEKGIINGFYEDDKAAFKPDSNITRIQFAAIISKSLGIDTNLYHNEQLNFTDADKVQQWAVDYVKAMASLGYITGRSDDGKTVYFAPDDSITRAEAFTVIGRILNKTDGRELNYTDSSQIPDWAKGAISALSSEGIINGFEDNSIRPHRFITRAEAAVLVDKSGI